MHATSSRAQESGVATIALVLVLVPMILVIGSYLQAMTERNQRLGLEIREEQALFAAESGVDYALNEARRGTLIAGPSAEYLFNQTLPDGSAFEVTCTYLRGDGFDDDGDGTPDDADEDVFRVESLGSTLSSRRRVAVYLGYSQILPSLQAAVTITNPGTTINLGGAARANGNNYNLSGAPVGSSNTYGIAITPPGTLAGLNAQLTGGEPGRVLGIGGTPSTSTAPAVDVASIVDFARNSATVVVTNSTVSTARWGSATAPVVAYRQGDVRIQGNSVGYGLLVVNGNLRLAGTFTWYGVIVCTGNVEAGTGTSNVYGGVLQGPTSGQLNMIGTADFRFSVAGRALAESVTGRYVAFNGWQELSTNN